MTRRAVWALPLLVAAVLLALPGAEPVDAQSANAPYVWIERLGPEEIDEGDPVTPSASFWVRVRPATQGGSVSVPFTVLYHVSSRGNATAEAGDFKEISVTNAGGTLLTVPITDDDKVTKDSRITVTLEPDRGYRLDHDAGIAAFVFIVDDDHGPPGRPNEERADVSVSAKGTVSHGGGVVTLPTVTEGGRVVFTVSVRPFQSSGKVRYPLTVHYKLTQTGDFITQTEGHVVINVTSDLETGCPPLCSNRKTATVAVPTTDDRVSEDDGTVTIEVFPGEGYHVEAGFNRATARVRDNDTPKLRFGADNLSVPEGPTDPDPMPVLHVDPAPHKPITVRLTTSDQGGGQWGAVEGQDYAGGSVDVTIPAGARFARVDLGAAGITVTNDSDAEDYESFWLTLEADPAERPAYLVGQDGNSEHLEIVIVDDDSPPEARLTPNADGTYTVPESWPLVPRGQGFEHGGHFRLLFVTTGTRDPNSAQIADYDAFVQASARGEQAGNAHEALKPYASLFKVVGATQVNAYDHIESGAHPDVPVYWLGGPRAVARQSDLFGSSSSHRWENQGEEDRRTAASASYDDRTTRESSVFTGATRDGRGGTVSALGGSGALVHAGAADGHPIQGQFPPRTDLLPFYAISPVFRVEPSPRLELNGEFTVGTLDLGLAGRRLGQMLVAEEPAACGQAANDVSEYGPVTHDEALLTYRVRLTRNPWGPATVRAYNPQLVKVPWVGGGYRPANTYQGGVTVRPAGEPTTYVQRRGSVTLNFDTSNWNDWQTVSLNVHCADHRNHEAYTIEHLISLPGDTYWEPTGTPGEVALKSRATWDQVRVKVIDTKSPPRPSDRSVSSAYGGTLTADVAQGGEAYGVRGGDGNRYWAFNLAYYWDTTAAGGTRNDVGDARKHFSAFKVRIEGDDSLSPPIPTYVTWRSPAFHPGIWAGDTRNTDPYHVGHFNYGLQRGADILVADRNTNPGNPVYRFTITPVTIRSNEVPGETITVCVQLQSVTGWPARKIAVKVDCSLFNAPTGEVEVIGLDYQMAQMSDSTPPTLTIAGDALGVTEGGDVTYTITANPPPAEEVHVEVAIKEQMGSGDDVIASEGRELLIIPAGESSVEWTVTAYSDDVERDDGTIVAELVAGAGYTLGEPSSVSMTLLDDDGSKPVVTISGGSGITEGGSASFTVSASPAPAANLDVKVTVSQSGDYGATTGQRTVTIPTSGSVVFSVGTTDDSADEADGSVTATVDADSGYTVSSSQDAATVSVSDNDDATPDYTDYQTVVDYLIQVRDNPENTAVQGNPAHILKWNRVLAAIGYDSGETPMAESEIHANAARWPDSPFKPPSVYLKSLGGQPVVSVSGGSGITEGGSASFTVSASPAPSANLDVKVTVTQSGDYGAITGQRMVTIPTSGSVTFTVGTTDDSTDETDGSVTATVDADSGYMVSSSQGAATVSVADNDGSTPEISVSGGSGITEGGSASFTVSASPAPSANLDVKVTVTQSGDYGATTGQRTVTIPTSGSVTFTVATTDDSADEADGSVTATLVDGAAYDLGTSKTATVTVSDDDDAPKPEVSVSGGSGITEGGSASFTVSASPAPSANLDVKVTITQNGDYGATTGQRTVTIPTSGSVTFTVGTTDDSADEADGSVTATVDAGSGYTVSSSQGAATVSVADNDDAPKPEVSVSGGSDITEGGSASFTVSASPAPSANLDVKVTITQNGDYGATTGQRTVTIPTSGSVTFTVGTTDDSADEADGSVTATVDAGSGYTVSSSQGAATVSVADNDDAPGISVTVEDASATEGGVLTFRVRLSAASTEEVRIRWYTAPAYDRVDDRAHRSDYQASEGELVFAAGVTELTAEVLLEQDNEDEPDEYFAVEAFLPGSFFTPDAVGTMTIVDDD